MTTPARVNVRNLAVDFSADAAVSTAVKRIPFTINRGETVALVG